MLVNRSNRENSTKEDEDLKKSRRRVHDATNKCKDVNILEAACNVLRGGVAQSGSASGS